MVLLTSTLLIPHHLTGAEPMALLSSTCLIPSHLGYITWHWYLKPMALLSSTCLIPSHLGYMTRTNGIAPFYLPYTLPLGLHDWSQWHCLVLLALLVIPSHLGSMMEPMAMLSFTCLIPSHFGSMTGGWNLRAPVGGWTWRIPLNARILFPPLRRFTAYVHCTVQIAKQK